jgi:hypothetical protein
MSTGWYENWRAKRTPLFRGFARHMRIKEITYFQQVLWVYQEIPGEAAWRLDADDAARVMAGDDLWHQPDAVPCWQRNVVPEFIGADIEFLQKMNIKL